MKQRLALDIQLLGGFRVRVDERVVHDGDWRLRKTQHLVKLLALAPGHRLHREQIMELLWPEQPPEAAANNLHKAIYTARRALEPGLPPSTHSSFLHVEWDAVVLEAPGGVRVDAAEFEHAASHAFTAAEEEAYASALALYTGELLPEDRYEDWVTGRREVLEGQYLALLVELAAIQEEQGQVSGAVDALARVVAREPIHEEAHVTLMRLYARTGQRHRALRQYQQLRGALRRELDLEPAPGTTQLYRDIVTGQWRAALRIVPPRSDASQSRATAAVQDWSSEPSGAAV